jgi:hypothetical protein
MTNSGVGRNFDDRHPSFAEASRRHAEACAAGLPCYRDPVSGLSVMTSETLLGRGYCCESGCRHCPYPVVPIN